MTPEEARAKRMRELVAQGLPKELDIPTSGLTPVADRPDVGKLYGRLGKLASMAPDMSPLAAINQAASEGSKRDFLGGLALSTLGGKTMAPAGNHLLVQALENGKPLRPNAADVGYTNQDTGEVIPNPMNAQNAEVKATEFQIKQLLTEQEKEERANLAQRAEATRRQEKQDQQATLAAIVNNGYRMTEAAMLRAEKAGGHGTKPLTRSELSDLTGMASTYDSWKRLSENFKDGYSGKNLGTPQVEAENYISNNFPKARNLVGMNSDKRKELDNQAAWWKDYERNTVLTERHQMFGSALTNPERASWAAASITPGMSATEIRKNVNIRLGLMEKMASVVQEAQIANGKHPDAVKSALGSFNGVERRTNPDRQSDDDLINKYVPKKP